MKVIKPYRYLDKLDIERQAQDVLRDVQTKRKRPLKWPPIDATIVAESLGLDVEWFTIPPDAQGSIAAMILPLERKIVINEAISQLRGGFGQSTLAHEVGHWMLHIDRYAVGNFIERADPNIEIAVEPFLCRSVSSQQGIEWQAQYFASCLLMPRDVLEQSRKGRNLTNWNHLYPMAEEFGVTISNLTNRLQDLRWIYIPKGSKQIYLGDTGTKA